MASSADRRDLDGTSHVRDVVIAGAGVAGTLLAILLDRAGVSVTLLDEQRSIPKVFRAEQVVSEEALQRLNLLDVLVGGAIRVPRADTYRMLGKFHWLAHRTESVHYGRTYDDMVNGARSHLSPKVEFLHERLEQVDLSSSTQRLTLRGGRTLDARLLVVATGPQAQLLGKLGMQRRVVSKHHSTAIGFDLAVPSHERFKDAVLTVHGSNWLGGERNGAIDYATFFLIGDQLRGNIFTNGRCDSAWVKKLKQDPIGTLRRAIPWLEQQIGPITGIDNVRVRPNDVSTLEDFSKPGVVCVGDTFMTPCPATGTGISRILQDIELLATRFVPQWLDSPGMDASKIKAFYDDVSKKACDDASLTDAMFHRGLTTGTGLRWAVRRVKKAAQEQWERAAHAFHARRGALATDQASA